MPRRTDISHVLVIGSGPIVIGQACEFDYSGTQACRVLRDEGIRVSLINSNPATIMTDPEFADATYVEPINAEFVEKVLADQAAQGFPVDAVLATLGGQTALNTAIALDERGVLEKYGVELIGADIPAINRGEDRQIFKDVVRSVGGDVPRSAVCHTMDEVRAAVAELGLPVVVRPSFTMGGLGSGMAYTLDDLERIAGRGLAASQASFGPVENDGPAKSTGHAAGHGQCARLGADRGKRAGLEGIRARADAGRQGQRRRGLLHREPRPDGRAHRRLDHRRAGDDAHRPRIPADARPRAWRSCARSGWPPAAATSSSRSTRSNGRIIVIEMNPRVSRSSALASKATGFPIAKIAAKLAIGYTLDEIANDITKATPAAFEPSLDYVVVKIPRFAFEKFPGADPTLTTTMKSVGEAMSIGRSFAEALGKAMRSMETKLSGFWTGPEAADRRCGCAAGGAEGPAGRPDLRRGAGAGLGRHRRAAARGHRHRPLVPGPDRPDPRRRQRGARRRRADPDAAARRPSGTGCPICRSLRCGRNSASEKGGRGNSAGPHDIRPVYKTVDTCAAEFAASTPYHYSAYETDPAAESEVAPQTERPKVIILGSGPNRIGQGIEFDYSCVHAALALRDAGYETVMVNCNPETVSTDYDTSDRLYFEPLTIEDVLEVIHAEQLSGTVAGVIPTLGGQTPLKLAQELLDAGVTILGTSPDAIDLAEDRGRFGELLTAAESAGAGVRHWRPRSSRPARSPPGSATRCWSGRPTCSAAAAWRSSTTSRRCADYIDRATEITDDHPVLVDRFLDDAIEIDVDALCDGTEVYLGGVMEHIEEAGIHSGDSACVLPPITLGRSDIAEVRSHTEAIALGVGVRGLLNVQYALKDETLYVLEANPRASRTVPFSSKATAVPLAMAAARIMLGATIAELRAEGMLPARGDGGTLPAGAPVAVKEAVLPFHRFRRPDGTGVDSLLGPEMRSTGEVMGIDTAFGPAFAKSQTASYGSLPTKGTVFVSVANADKRSMVFPVKRLADLGFRIVATEGTAEMLQRNGMDVEVVSKYFEGEGTGEGTVVELIRAGEIDLVINTPYGQSGPRVDGYEIRTAAVSADIPCITTVAGAAAAIQGIEALTRSDVGVAPLQVLHARLRVSREQEAG